MPAMTTDLIRPPYAKRVATARRIGEDQMQLALDAATSTDPGFGARAYKFIVAYVREQSALLGSVSGESVTFAARAAGIRPRMTGPSAPFTRRQFATATFTSPAHVNVYAVTAQPAAACTHRVMARRPPHDSACSFCLRRQG